MGRPARVRFRRAIKMEKRLGAFSYYRENRRPPPVGRSTETRVGQFVTVVATISPSVE